MSKITNLRENCQMSGDLVSHMGDKGSLYFEYKKKNGKQPTQ